MAAQAGLYLAWSETPEDTFCRVVAHMYVCDLSLLPQMALRIPTLLLEVLVIAENIIVSLSSVLHGSWKYRYIYCNSTLCTGQHKSSMEVYK